MSHSECTHEATKSARARCRRQRNAQQSARLSDAELAQLVELSDEKRNALPEEIRVQMYAYLVRLIES